MTIGIDKTGKLTVEWCPLRLRFVAAYTFRVCEKDFVHQINLPDERVDATITTREVQEIRAVVRNTRLANGLKE